MNTITKLGLTLTLCGLIASSTQAAVLLSDSFETGTGDYTAGSRLEDQTGTPETGGYGDPWDGGNTNFGYPGVTATGLTYTGLASSGGAAELNRTNSGTFVRGSEADLTGTPDASNDSVYFSGLIQLGGANWASLGANFKGDNNSIMGIGINSSGFGELRYDSNVVTASSALSGWSSSDTVFVVGKIENNGAGSGDDELSLFLNPSLSSEPTSATVSTGVGTKGWFPSESLGSLHIDAEVTGGEPATFFDEIRIGESWDDVSPIPEPGTLALVGILLGTLILFRRRR